MYVMWYESQQPNGTKKHGLRLLICPLEVPMKVKFGLFQISQLLDTL